MLLYLWLIASHSTTGVLIIFGFSAILMVQREMEGTAMDQGKIGRFIAERRRLANLTQRELAEQLLVTDRAVSKWENGRAMPDSSIMLDLCRILSISVNDLFCGEVISMEDYNKELEKNLIEMTKKKEEADRRLLRLEIVIGFICVGILLALDIFAAYLPIADWQRIILIVIGFVPIFVATPFMLKIEQVAGYYECRECGHKYVPTFKAVNLAPHMGRTRKMRCPKCGKKSWQKKVISKD